jgi:para-aminobenzoate synthetase component I
MRAAPRLSQIELATGLAPAAWARALDRDQPASLFLDGAGSSAHAWSTGPLVAVEPKLVPTPALTSRGLAALERIVALRRGAGGAGTTGIAALVGYDAGAPELTIFEIDRSLTFPVEGGTLLSERGDDRSARARLEHLGAAEVEAAQRSAARGVDRPKTSLPREAYLRAVERVRRHIARGDVYQANLCQELSVPYAGEPFELYAGLRRRTPAPRSAFVRAAPWALASMSPEVFLDADAAGRIETRPIKGTRARGTTATLDRQAAHALVESPKDRAELLMIVDLERNDLSRVCRAGSVRTPELWALESFPAVHHLVARVEGRLREGVRVAELIRATFPGGSITGAPKLRAMQILRRLEPVPRGLFTGSLFWFGDDGRTESSILIRGCTFDGTVARVGAGGGIVADSDAEQEWRESNHKAAALCAALGFAPEEAA